MEKSETATNRFEIDIMSLFRRVVFEVRLMRLSFVVHLLMTALLAVASAAACRILLLIPFWLGAVFGIVIYVAIILGLKTEDRFD